MTVELEGVAKVEMATVNLHPKDPSIGTRMQCRGPAIKLEQVRVQSAEHLTVCIAYIEH